MNPLVVSAFFMGLFGGAHCVAMCGGVSSMLCGAVARCPTMIVAYNIGRIACYTLLGGAFGALGSLSTSLDGVRFALRASAAVMMLAVGLHFVGLPSFMKPLESAGAVVWRRVAPLARRLLPIESPLAAVVAGVLWGFMPCGLLYGALVLAVSTGAVATAAQTMIAFGVGTLPTMLAAGALASAAARLRSRHWIRSLAGAAILGFGLYSAAGLIEQSGIAGGFGRHACCPRH